jgi:SAM-dependent methyltransferase
MHPVIYEEFEKICAAREIHGSVLEIGTSATANSLLRMQALSNASEKIGLDLEAAFEFDDVKVLQGNANEMVCFPDARFDAVLCNAVLEHDKYFWQTLAEIKRVTKPGGWIVIGVPGYARLKGEIYKSAIGRIPFVRRLQAHRYLGGLFHSTLTFQIHNHPGDYYRFGPQAVREVLLEGLEEIEVRSLMLPPRFIGVGRKKA